MRSDEGGDQFRLTALVEHATGDNQVDFVEFAEFAEFGVGAPTIAAAGLERRQAVEGEIGE